jgi:C-terminal processing protease CtpA/Prc
MRHRILTFSVFGLATLIGCSSPEAAKPNVDGPGVPADTTPRPATADDVCGRLSGGSPSTGSPLVEFARAAGAYRFFGPGTDTSPGEAALAKALASGSTIDEATLATFVAGLDGACSHAAESRALPAVNVEQRGSTAIVHPGVGDVSIPPGTASVALDLRDLPQSKDLMPALERAFAAASKTAVALLDERSRACNGQPDEVYALQANIQNVYQCQSSGAPGRVLEGKGETDLPLVLLTGPKIAPDAAAFAVSLRARGRAWLIGEDIPAGTAESDWFGVGEAGIFVRTRSLLLTNKSTKIPDVVSADVRTSDPVSEWTQRPLDGDVPALAGDAKRPDFEPRKMPTALRTPTDAPGDGRAALVLAYASVRTFWPYVAELSAPIDDRLVEAMQQLDSEIGTGRPAVTRALQRFGEALSDGHVGIQDFGAPRPSKYAPIAVVPYGSDIVVASSATDAVKAGETILAIDGEAIGDALSRMGRLLSCSPHEKASFASSNLFIGKPSPSVRVRALNGTERDVQLAGVTKRTSAFGQWDRAAGPLADLGASDVFYVTLNAYGAHPPSKVAPSVIDQGLASARAVVLDMRGYPEMAAWDILAKIIPQDSQGPKIAMLDVTPRRTVSVDLSIQTLGVFAAGTPTFTGPVVLLVGHDSQSQAEHLTSFFKDAKRGKVIGAQTSGANGNITGIQLPGGYGMTFTGLYIAHQDGSRFFGIGHVPDVVVEPAPADFEANHDVVLEKAIQLLAP